MSNYVDNAEDDLRWAGKEPAGSDQGNYGLKVAHVHAMLAVALEVAELNKTMGKYLEAATHPRTMSLNFGTPEPTFTAHLVCRGCGCSDKDACVSNIDGNCWWADLDEQGLRGGPLCSACVKPEDKQYTTDLPKAERIKP